MHKKRPNILIFCTDQQRYDALGCTGNRFAQTPNIDALAREGTLFRRHITTNPVCMPSRASFWTGCYPTAHCLWTNGVALQRTSPHSHPETATDLKTLATVLNTAGYHTRSVGKLHLTPYQADPKHGYEESEQLFENAAHDAWHGPYYGFEHVAVTTSHGENCGGHYKWWLRKNFPELARQVESKPAVQRDFEELKDLYRGVLNCEAHHSTWIGSEAAKFIAGRKGDADRPFMLYVSFPDPHHPFTPPGELARDFESHDTLPVRAPAGRSKIFPAPGATAASV